MKSNTSLNYFNKHKNNRYDTINKIAEKSVFMVVTLSLIASFTMTATAQPLEDTMQEQFINDSAIDLQDVRSGLVGCYSNNNDQFSLTSVCLFADGSYFYPTHVNQSGTYSIDSNTVVFQPKARNLFEVYARYNPQIMDDSSAQTSTQKTKFYFSGFNHENLFNFNQQGFSVMPSKPDCQGGYKLETYVHDNAVDTLDLAYAQQGSDSFIVFNYDINQNNGINKNNARDRSFNEFLLVAQSPQARHVDFSGKILTDEGDVWLQLSKDVLSMQKMDLSENKVQAIKHIGMQANQTEKKYELLDQQDIPSVQNIKLYQLDRSSNRYFSQRENTHSDTKNNNGNYLKLCEKIEANAQKMGTASVETRTIFDASRCQL